MEGLEAKAQPSMANLTTEEDTCPKVRGEWCKVLDSCPNDASSWSMMSSSSMSWPSSL